MTDITMCKGEDCPMKASCYRFLAEEDQENQTFFSKPPFIIEEDEAKCKFHWHILEERDEY